MLGVKLTKLQILTIIYCFIIDIVDYLGIGLIPYLGDILDIIAVGLITKAFGEDAWDSNILQSIEIVPFADILPLTIFAILLALWKTKKKVKKKKL